MENRVFAEANNEHRKVILDILREERMAVSLNFNEDGRRYFEKKYPDLYEYNIVNKQNNNVGFTARIDSVDRETGIISATLVESFCGDGDHETPEYLKYRTPNNPDGIRFEFQVCYISGICIFHDKVR